MGKGRTKYIYPVFYGPSSQYEELVFTVQGPRPRFRQVPVQAPTAEEDVFGEGSMPTDPEKDEGTATIIGLLGIELDTEASWRRKKACKKRELLSLIGSLSHACKAVRAGRSFLRRLIDLSTTVKHLNHFVRLGASARSDIHMHALI